MSNVAWLVTQKFVILVPLRAVAGVARPRRALSQLLTRHTTTCRAGTFAVSSWSKVWDVEGVTFLAVLPNGVCSRSDCGLPPSLWRCVSFCPISCHKSIGGRSSSRWRAGRSTSSRRRGTGRSRRVAAASRRSGEERKKSRAGRGSLCELCKSRKTVVRTVRVSLRHDTTYDFRKTSNAAGAGLRFICTL